MICICDRNNDMVFYLFNYVINYVILFVFRVDWFESCISKTPIFMGVFCLSKIDYNLSV